LGFNIKAAIMTYSEKPVARITRFSFFDSLGFENSLAEY